MSNQGTRVKMALATEEKRPRKERKENAERRRRQILDATCRSIVSHGLQRTTLATVANEAGLSQGVAVFYFKSKNGLLTEALRDLYIAYERHWIDALEGAGEDPVRQLVALVRADFDAQVCNPEILSIWFAFWGEQKFTPQYAAVTLEFDRRRQEAMQSVFQDLLPHDPARAAHVAEWIETLTDGYWQHLHLFPEQGSKEQMLDGCFQFLAAQLPECSDAIEACARQE